MLSVVELQWTNSNYAESVGVDIRSTTPTELNLHYTQKDYGGYNEYANGSGTTAAWVGSALPNCTSYAYGRATEFLDRTQVDLYWTTTVPGTSDAEHWFANNKDWYDYYGKGFQYMSNDLILSKFARNGKVINRKDNPFTFAGCIGCMSVGGHVFFIEKEIIQKNNSGDDTWQWVVTESGAGSTPYNFRTQTVDPRTYLLTNSANGVIILPRNTTKKSRFPWAIYKGIIY